QQFAPAHPRARPTPPLPPTPRSNIRRPTWHNSLRADPADVLGGTTARAPRPTPLRPQRGAPSGVGEYIERAIDDVMIEPVTIAGLLDRVFAVDVTVCRACGG